MEIERLKALEVQMKELVGNGQPGRIQKIEDEMKVHSKLLWVGIGGLMLLQIMAANGWLKFH